MRTGTGPALAIGGRKGENRGRIWQRGQWTRIVLGDDHEKAESLSQVSRGRVPGNGAGVFPPGSWLAGLRAANQAPPARRVRIAGLRLRPSVGHALPEDQNAARRLPCQMFCAFCQLGWK